MDFLGLTFAFELRHFICYTCQSRTEAKIKNAGYFIAILLLSFWGCAGPQYYDLHIKPLENENSPQIDKILMVDDVETNETFWRQGMVIRKTPYRLEYMPFEQWVKIPGEMIKDAIIHFYKNSFLFAKVIDENSSIEPEILMKTQVDALEMLYEDSQWHAHLSLDFEFVDFKMEKTFLTHYFDRKMVIEGKNPKYMPEKISQILQEELLIIVEKLKEFNFDRN